MVKNDEEFDFPNFNEIDASPYGKKRIREIDEEELDEKTDRVVKKEVKKIIKKGNFRTFNVTKLVPLLSLKSLFKDLIESLKPPPREPVSATVERIMKIPNKSGLPLDFSVQGRAAYMREPIDLLNSRHYNEIIFMGCARSGKTEALVKGFASYAMYTARDIMILQMSGEKAIEFAKKDFQPTIFASPELKDLIRNRREDLNLKNYSLKKGSWVLIRKPAVTDLAGTTVQYVVLTDYDRMDQNLDGEGTPWALGRTRTTTYGFDAMAVAESSPGFPVVNTEQLLEPHDAYDCEGIAALYNQGDKRCFYFQCLNCREWFWATPETITWDKQETNDTLASRTARVECSHCFHKHTDEERLTTLIPRGKWIRKGEKIDKDGNVSGAVTESKTASFWLRAPACGFISLEEIVYRYLSALRQFEKTGDEQNLKAVVNTVFGDPFITRNLTNNANVIKEKLEESNDQDEIGVAPRDTVMIVAAVDQQCGNKDSRFVVQIFAITKSKRYFLIDRFDITEWNGKRINPAVNDSSMYDCIDKMVVEYRAKIKDTNLTMAPYITLLDIGGAGNATVNSYSFYRSMVKKRKSDRIRLVKGENKVTPFKVYGIEFWCRYGAAVTSRAKASSWKANIFRIVPNFFKHRLFNIIQRNSEEPYSITFNKGIPEQVAKELSAETLDERGVYVKRYNGIRNEAIDLFVYFLALVEDLKIEVKIDENARPNWLLTAEEGNAYCYDAVTNTLNAPAREPKNKDKKVTKGKKVKSFSFIGESRF
ncbi:hypothetical protein CKF54_00915 [Psittacicella hinzii]|uniref:Uncharacterized protein n=1 Tax=Psittacicella hinzii TaxID=2028575 RepID=A0A3A1YDS8_9GAMM|nr:terminase gpA endonuclease subunit [Psittacicella hinzii]RIY34334.1 hypothetical protein CKF54_00915 [Psittacicella hinzii]